MSQPRNLFQAILRGLEWCAIGGVIIGTVAFLFGFDIGSDRLPAPSLAFFSFITWGIAGVLSRVPQDE